MMISDELPGSWDQPTNSIVLHKREPSKLQELALQFVSDTGSVGSLTRFVQSNEAMLQDRMGGGGDNNNYDKRRRRGDDSRRRW
jgi:translation initiation factor 3 subunit C